MAYPMTLIVIVVLAGCLAEGIAMTRHARRSHDPAAGTLICPSYRKGNLGRAKFCAHCGTPVK